MIVGTADAYEGSVSFGSVMNLNATEVLITANASHGNSGGPVVDNEGRVIGTLTNGYDGEQYNVAKSLDAMCAKILKCDGKYYWEE
jgi:S1-C subfamily serine protease